MHPAIKIVNLIIVSIFLTQGGWSTLFLTGALLLPFYLSHLEFWGSAIKMLYRLKWFFISILLIYYYYTPHVLTSDSLQVQSAFVQFLQHILPGMFRISVLVFILFSVNLFIKTTTKEEILSALLWLFLPLRIFNIDIERLSLRAVLTLEYIEDLSVRLSNYKQNKSLELSNKDAKTGYFSSEFYLKRKDHFLHLIEHSGIIFREILKEAEKTSGKSYTLDCLESPKFIQFSYPLGLFLIYFYSL